MPTQDQVVWASVAVATGDESRYFRKGDLLPDPADPEEAATRALLRIGGAIRTVEVVYTPDELAAAAAATARITAEREAPAGQPPGPPVIAAGPSSSPVVIGPEDSAEAKTSRKVSPAKAPARDEAKAEAKGGG